MVSYYNENDPYCAEWLRNLVLVGLLPEGDVDDRSISDVNPNDLIGYDQVHCFAGVGGWPLAAQLVGWPDDRESWTGSCPCQPFSNAGRRRGAADPRHLWPDFFALIRARRPLRVAGEQITSKLGRAWFDGVRSDLENIAYVTGVIDIPACSVNAPHIRNRLWWYAEAGYVGDGEIGSRWSGTGSERGAFRGSILGDDGDDDGALVNSPSIGRREGQSESEFRSGWPTVGGPSSSSSDLGDSDSARHPLCGVPGEFREPQRGTLATPERAGGTPPTGHWDEYEWIACADGKQRRVKPGVHLLVNGSTARIPRIRASGNAIVPALAAEIIKAWMAVAP